MKFVAYLLVVHCMLVNNQIIYNFNISVDEDRKQHSDEDQF